MVSVYSKWSGINKLSVFYTDQGSSSDIKQLGWNVDLQNSITRKLFNETHNIFQEFQNVCAEGVVGKNSVLNFSRQYRAVLQSCMIKLKEKLAHEKRDEVIEVMGEQLDVFNILEMLWHLCEVIFIECQPGSCCINLLLEWVKWHFNEVDQYAQNVVAAPDPHMHPDYWKTVYGLVGQGRLSEVIDLLTHHPYKEEGRFDVFASIEELLSTMPNNAELGVGNSETTFENKWHLWKSECSARLNNGDFTDYPELEALCLLLNGDESTLLENDICSTWYQLMVFKLLYGNPTVKTSNLKAFAVECMEQMNGVGCFAELDEIILSVLSLDVHKFMEKTSDVMTNWWFSLHLGDLFYHYGLLKTFELNYGEDIRTFLLLEYGSSLMSHQCLWNIGGDYLSCSKEGRAMLENYVEKIHVNTEKKALKLLHFCDKYNLVEQHLSICKTMGMKALHRGRYGVALSWCLRSKDQVFASQLTDKYLDHYMATGTFLPCDIIENLGSQMLLNNKLTFLAKYYEFHQLYISKDFKNASSLLVSLLTSNIAPRKFWMTLLIDSLPLLQHDELMFTYEQTFELMQCLTELKLCHNITDNHDKKNKINWDSEKIHILNLALCKNLSRSSLLEPESIMPIR